MIQQFEAPHAQLRPPLWNGRVVFGRFVLTLVVNRKVRQKLQPEPLLNRLAVLRRERGFSRAELAGLLHIHHSTLVAMEEGSYLPSIRLALDISTFFNLPVDSLFYPAQREQFVGCTGLIQPRISAEE